jgi:hypothetical protein
MSTARPQSPQEPPRAGGKGIGVGEAAAGRSGHLGRTVGSRYVDTHSAAQVAAVVAELAALDLEHAPPAALAALLTACAGTQTRIAVRLARASAEASPAPAPAAPEAFVSVKAAAGRLGVAPKWLYRRTRSLPFMREMVPGTWRVSVVALERWMARRGHP